MHGDVGGGGPRGSPLSRFKCARLCSDATDFRQRRVSFDSTSRYQHPTSLMPLTCCAPRLKVAQGVADAPRERTTAVPAFSRVMRFHPHGDIEGACNSPETGDLMRERSRSHVVTLPAEEVGEQIATIEGFIRRYSRHEAAFLDLELTPHAGVLDRNAGFMSSRPCLAPAGGVGSRLPGACRYFHHFSPCNTGRFGLEGMMAS
jgi:hypothetical protein